MLVSILSMPVPGTHYLGVELGQARLAVIIEDKDSVDHLVVDIYNFS